MRLVSFVLLVLLFSGIAAAHTVTFNFAVRTGNAGSDFTIRANDTDFGTTPTSLTFTGLGKKYLLARIAHFCNTGLLPWRASPLPARFSARA